jgi:predicted RNA-binding Zn ribbon-like protein
MRSGLDGDNQCDVPASAAELFANGPVRVALDARILSDGSVHFTPAGSGWKGLLVPLLLEMRRAQDAGTWARLKSCRNDRCRGVFYDRSRNNSGVWHDVRTCGNAANLRASRERRRAAAVRQDVEGGTRT